MRGLEKVRAEFSLTTLDYNLRRVLNIVGFTELMAAVAQGAVAERRQQPTPTRPQATTRLEAGGDGSSGAARRAGTGRRSARFRQIERSVDEAAAVARSVGGEHSPDRAHSHLAV